MGTAEQTRQWGEGRGLDLIFHLFHKVIPEKVIFECCVRR